MNRTLSKGVFLLGLACLTASISTMSCGGSGGGGGSAVAAPAPGSGGTIHVSSSVAGPQINASSFTVVREITFTPAAGEVLLHVFGEGTFTNTGVGSGSTLVFEIRTSNGVLMGGSNVVSLTGGSVNRPFRMLGGLSIPTVSDKMAITFPDSSYKVRCQIQTDAGWVGSINDIRFKIVTVAAGSVDPSPAITG